MVVALKEQLWQTWVLKDEARVNQQRGGHRIPKATWTKKCINQENNLLECRNESEFLQRNAI